MKITKAQLKELIKEEIESLSVDELYITEQFETSSDDRYKPGMRDEHVYSEGEIRFIQRSLEKAITRAFDTLRDGSAVERERAVRDAFEPAMEEAMRMLHSDE